MHAEFNNGSAVSRDITRHFSAPFGSETTLGCTRQLTGRLSNARIATPPPDERLVEIKHIAKSPQPGERASCSAWAICLGLAGRLHVARQSLFGERGAQCQESSNRATRKASITLTGLGKATIFYADPGSGVHHVPFDQTTRRRFVTLFGGAALTAATTVAARAQSAAKPARQLAAKTPDAAADKLDFAFTAGQGSRRADGGGRARHRDLASAGLFEKRRARGIRHFPAFGGEKILRLGFQIG